MKGLENFKNLTRLSFTGGDVQDYSPLKELHKLSNLSLGKFNSMNLDCIKELTQLEYLSIYDSPIIDISDLSNLKSVRNLAVLKTQVKDISVMNQMPSLGYVRFEGNQIEELPTLQNSNQIYYLSLNQNKIKSVEGLKGLDALIRLSIMDNQIETLAPLRGLTGLQELIAMRNKIQTMEGINEMTGLQELSLTNNELTEVMPVTNLTALKKFSVAVNHISNITPFRDIPDTVNWDAGSQFLNLPKQRIGKGDSLTVINSVIDEENILVTNITPRSEGIFYESTNTITWNGLDGEGSVYYVFRGSNQSHLFSGFVYAPYEVVEKRMLTFDSDSVAPQALVSGGKAIEPETVAKNGYTFQGWTWEENGIEKVWVFATTVMPDYDVLLQEKWSLNKYQLAYDGNGADENSLLPSSQTFTVEEVATVVEPTRLTKKGYHFLEWNSKADGTGENYATGEPISEASDIMLYAQWEANTYTIQFELNGGDSEIPGAQILNMGEYIEKPATPTRAGFEFQGWKGMENGKELMWNFNQGTVSDEDMILTAVWKKENSAPINPVTSVTPSIPVTPVLPVSPNTPVASVLPNDQITTGDNGKSMVQYASKLSVEVEPKTKVKTNIKDAVNQSILPPTGESSNSPITMIGGILAMGGLAYLIIRRRF
ncbi:InlB B-repeat-containing protein [Listeria cornellensis]|uniref:Internalin A n=1 Tax=Listeria cornellensis FSL F6-0969 TaxID=1265820 RepID=W7C1S8_9LIST|nr:InlB B-repeat-containing protein [Listeria cornellensis]EUJ29556.1 Internalin A [Listeria cornellensis FSL F6-0969]